MNKPFNIDACVSTEIERHLGTNRAFPTVKTHHRQHATISPEAGHIRLQECLSPKRHPPRERQLTIGSGDHTRHPTQTAKIRASLSNIHSEATLVTHTRGALYPRARVPHRTTRASLANYNHYCDKAGTWQSIDEAISSRQQRQSTADQHCAHPNLISSGHACTKPMQRRLGVSTFPWGCATDTREKESPLTVYDP
ncbi:hypothetical protein CDL15_Pgr027184 [Punica granatum]|uniref:Uncharacterized protein n=1 Tax=Punica granatum TaxID=22663 RepID=A0A218VX08_PUNGR|nr:hypothetical protein CDL15_Pgr027184 [Punica granatum]